MVMGVVVLAFNVCVAYPTYEISMVSPSPTCIENCPSMLVIVPPLPSLLRTLTPTSGSPLVSVTVPLTVLCVFCCKDVALGCVLLVPAIAHAIGERANQATNTALLAKGGNA